MHDLPMDPLHDGICGVVTFSAKQARQWRHMGATPAGAPRRRETHICRASAWLRQAYMGGGWAVRPSDDVLPHAGRALHSSQRRDDEAEFRGKSVLVVGGGKSAEDAAAAAVAAGAVRVVHSLQSVKWMIPSEFFGIIPCAAPRGSSSGCNGAAAGPPSPLPPACLHRMHAAHACSPLPSAAYNPINSIRSAKQTRKALLSPRQG